MGPVHPAQARHRRRPHRPARRHRALRRVLHAPGPARRRRPDPGASCASSPTSATSSPAAPPTSATARTSSTTGSASRTCPRSGAASRRSACRPPRPAATPRASSSAARWPASPPTRSSTPRPVIDEITSRFIGDPELANLPRKFKSAITGHPSLDVVHEINDISLVGVVHPELGAGYDLWVGGGLSTAPRLAERIGVFVAPDRAAEVWLGVISHLPRLRLPPAAHQGPPEVPPRRVGPRDGSARCSRREYLGHAAPRRTAARRRPPVPATTSACTCRRTATTTSAPPRSSAGSAATCSPASPTSWRPPAPTGCGSPRTRSSSCSTSPRTPVDDLVAGLERLGLSVAPSPFRRHTMACTGIEFCKLAIVETKATAATAIAELERRLADVPTGSTPRSPSTSTAAPTPAPASRSPTSASRADDRHHRRRAGARLPGAPRRRPASADRDEAGLGRTVRGLKVTADDLPDLVERARAPLARPARGRARRSPAGPTASTRRSSR